MNKFIDALRNIFIPIIPMIILAGILMSINNFILLPIIIRNIANIIFSWILVLISISSAKTFKANIYYACVIGLILISDESFKYGIDYSYTVLPIIFSIYVLSKIEKILKKILGDLNFFIPIISVISTAIITLKFLGPIFFLLGNLITKFIIFIYLKFGFIGTSIFGLFYPIFVMVGVHHIFLPIELNLIKNNGTYITPIAGVSNISQAGAVLAVYILNKNKKEKKSQLSGLILSILGVSEPAMFETNLKYRYPFYASIIASAISGGYIGLTRVLATSIGVSGIFSFIILPKSSWVSYLIASLLAFIISFLITYILEKKHMV